MSPWIILFSTCIITQTQYQHNFPIVIHARSKAMHFSFKRTNAGMLTALITSRWLTQNMNNCVNSIQVVSLARFSSFSMFLYQPFTTIQDTHTPFTVYTWLLFHICNIDNHFILETFFTIPPFTIIEQKCRRVCSTIKNVSLNVKLWKRLNKNLADDRDLQRPG